MTSDAQTITLADGRTMGWCEFGDPVGVPVIALHGTPGSKLKYGGLDGAARELGLRLISVDRWGYGLTSMKPNGTLTDFGRDMVVLADRLGLKRCLVTGVSGAGPFAVATAAALGPRAIALALVSPIGVIDRTTRLSPFHYVCFRVLPHLPGTISAVFQLYRMGLRVAPHMTMRLAVSLGPKVDRQAVAEDAVRHRLIETFSSGMLPGTAGAVGDMALFVRPWDLDFTAVSAVVRTWIGTFDKNVPQDGVTKLAAVLPGSELIQLPGEGHLWVATHGHVVIDWLAQQAKTEAQSVAGERT